MGANQSDLNDSKKYDALKKLYGMGQQEMIELKQQLIRERLMKLKQSQRNLNNPLVKQTLNTNSMMQRQFLNTLQQEQHKLKNKINHSKYDKVNDFLQSLTVDIDEYDKKTELFTNQGTVNQFEPKSNLNTVNNQYSQRQDQSNRQREIQPHKNQSFLSKVKFEEQEMQYEQEFEQQEKLRRQNFRNNQRSRRDEYMHELRKFKSSVDPYKLLKVRKDFTEEELKQAYRKLVLVSHPDRPNGSNEKFQIVTKAYMTLLEEFKLKQTDKQFTQLRDEAQDYMNNQMRHQKTNIKLNGEKFDIQSFNKIYDDNRLHEPEDDGYDKWIKNTSYKSDDIKKNDLFSKKFNLNIFNTVFDKETKNTSTAVVQYTEPQAMNSGGDNCVILGQDKISNFSGKATNGFTDYREAFTTSRLVDPSTVQRQEFKDLDDIKSARGKIEKFTDEEIYRQEQDKINQEDTEYNRQERLRSRDERAFDNYSKVHSMLLNYRN